jgi:uncharacterized membrane protein
MRENNLVERDDQNKNEQNNDKWLSDSTKDTLVNNRFLGHTRHPTITDVPFGSWTVTLLSDILEASGKQQFALTADTSLGVGLTASLLASAGGLADLSETEDPTDHRLGAMHGILQGLTTLLYGGSFIARRSGSRLLGRVFSVSAYGTLITAAYLAAELVKRRKAEA